MRRPVGAGEGNRTLAPSLASSCSIIGLCTHLMTPATGIVGQRLRARIAFRHELPACPLHPPLCGLIVNRMVQCQRAPLNASFAALTVATRRGILERLGHADASIAELAGKFRMTLTAMKKHIWVLEQAGSGTTEKVRRVRTCQLGDRGLEEEAAWIKRYRQRWVARFGKLVKIIDDLRLEKRDQTSKVK